MQKTKSLSVEEKQTFLQNLKQRFEKHPERHPDISWVEVSKRLNKPASGEKLQVLFAMEETGGEPDVMGKDGNSGEFIFFDCAAESPRGRRSLCYDRKALEARKKFPPKNSVMDLAEEIGAELMDETQYRQLQESGEFDTKTSSWIKSPEKIRSLGGALFCDRRYDTVFVYHNGADSYYASRGFRLVLRI